MIGKLLLALIMTCTGLSLVGCSDKQTVKTAEEKPTADRVPPPPREK